MNLGFKLFKNYKGRSQKDGILRKHHEILGEMVTYSGQSDFAFKKKQKKNRKIEKNEKKYVEKAEKRRKK